MKLLSGVFLFFFLLLSTTLFAREVVYTKADSLRIEQLLLNGRLLPCNGDKLLFFARSFIGIPYVAATLEREEGEALVVNTRGLDCTTFVETTFALYLASCSDSARFDDYLSALQTLRYRGGQVDGYCSRLHYFTEWIVDNERQGLLKDVSGDISDERLSMRVNFMSTHPDSYYHLRNNPKHIEVISAIEERISGTEAYYISRRQLASGIDLSGVRDGDIIALITDIEGLDASHVGFAYWQQGELYLLHASSKYKKVVADSLPLREYVLAGKRNKGLRVVRVQ